MRQQLVALASAARRIDGVLDAAALIELDRAFLDSGEADGAPDRTGRVRLDRETLSSTEAEVQARAVRIVARRFGRRLTTGGTRAAVTFVSRGRSGTAIDLADGLQIAREFDVLWFGRSGQR